MRAQSEISKMVSENDQLRRQLLSSKSPRVNKTGPSERFLSGRSSLEPQQTRHYEDSSTRATTSQTSLEHLKLPSPAIGRRSSRRISWRNGSPVRPIRMLDTPRKSFQRPVETEESSIGRRREAPRKKLRTAPKPRKDAQPKKETSVMQRFTSPVRAGWQRVGGRGKVSQTKKDQAEELKAALATSVAWPYGSSPSDEIVTPPSPYLE